MGCSSYTSPTRRVQINSPRPTIVVEPNHNEEQEEVHEIQPVNEFLAKKTESLNNLNLMQPMLKVPRDSNQLSDPILEKSKLIQTNDTTVKDINLEVISSNVKQIKFENLPHEFDFTFLEEVHKTVEDQDQDIDMLLNDFSNIKLN